MTKKINLENQLKLMVGLDLTEMDQKLVEYINFLCEVWNIEHIYFTHNIKQYKLYDLHDDFVEKGITVEDIIDRALQKTIDNHYTSSVPHTLLITTDDYTESILSQLAEDYDIDIMVTGNKDELQGTGALSQKLVRMLESHVLLVPEEASHKMENVLIPTDFSPASARCFPVAASLVARSGGKIEAVHVYDIPQFFFPYINTEKAHDKTKLNLKEKVQQFRKKYPLAEQVTFKYIDREDHSIVEAIEIQADRSDSDMVVVSARGGNNITTLFVGSTTNDLLARNRKMPLLVVR